MAIEATIVTKVDNTQAVNAQVGLRKEIRLLRDELEKLDEGTEEYQRTFNRLSTAMKTQQDRQMALRTSSGDLGDIIGNTTKTIAGLAGGFQAAQGAMILFGVESEDLQKALVKIQAAMSFTQGIAQLENLTKSIPALINNVKGYFRQIGETTQTIQSGSKVVGDTIVGMSTKTVGSNIAVATSIGGVSDTLTQETAVLNLNINTQKAKIESDLAFIKVQISKKNAIIEAKEAEKASDVFDYDTERLDEQLKTHREELKKLTDTQSIYEKELKGLDAQTKSVSDSTEKLGNTVNKTSSGFKGFAINILKTLGVMALISVAIAAIVDAYKTFTDNVDKNTEAIDLNGERMLVNKGVAENLINVTEEYNKEANKSFGEAIGKYQLLKAAWLDLKTAQDKREFLKNNIKTLNDLSTSAFGASKEINTITEAQDFLIYRSSEFRRAMIKNAEIMAYQSALVKLNSDLFVQRAEADAAYAKLSLDNSKENQKAAKAASDKWYATYLTLENLKGKISKLDLENIKLGVFGGGSGGRGDKKPEVEEEWIGSASTAKEVFEELPSIWDIIEQKRVEYSRRSTQEILDDYDNMFKSEQLNKANKFNELLIQQYEEVAKKNFWYYWFTPTDDLQNQIDRSNRIIQDAQSNIAFRIDENTMLLQQLKNLDLTAEKRAEIEAKITENERVNVEDRVRIAEEEFIKRRAINENLMAISEEGFNAASSSFQAIIDNNDAAFEETRANLEAQYEQGEITKEKYDKQLLKAQQDQNEKNKKWQAGIAMIDGLVGAGKALSGAMELGPIAGPIIGGIQAAAIIASTAATIKKIYAQRVSDSGASSSNASVSATAASAINAPLNYSANVLTQSQEAQLNKPTKVYVVESDITEAQNKNRVIVSESTF